MARAANPTLIGLGYDASSSFLRGAAEAPRHIRAALRSPSSNGWSERGIDVLAAGAPPDAGDLPLAKLGGRGAPALHQPRPPALAPRRAPPLPPSPVHTPTYPP